MSGEMTPPTLDELLASDLDRGANRLALGDALASAGRYAEANLARDLLLPVRVAGGRVVRGDAREQARIELDAAAAEAAEDRRL